MSVISTKKRLASTRGNTALRLGAGASVSALALASVSAEAQSGFVALPGAQYVIDQATGNARVTYQGQMYQVNAGHYQVGADGSLSISSEAAATVAPNLGSSLVNTAGNVVDGTFDLAGDAANAGGDLLGDMSGLVLGGGILGAIAIGGLGFTAFQYLNNYDVEITSVDGNSVTAAATTAIASITNTAKTFDVVFTDDNWLHGYSATVDNANYSVSINNKTATITYNGTNFTGSDTVNVTITDDNGNNDTDTITVNVGKSAAVAGAPSVTITSSDANLTTGEVATITVTFSEGVSGFVASELVATGGTLSNFTAVSSTVYTATFTPPANSSTNATINVAAGVATDDANEANTAAATLTLTVNTTGAGNSAPVFADPSDDYGDLVQGNTITFSPATDANNDALTYTIDAAATTNGFTIDSGTTTIMAGASTPLGAHTITVTATDPSGATATYTITVNVLDDGNTAGSSTLAIAETAIDAGPYLGTSATGDTITISVDGSDKQVDADMEIQNFENFVLDFVADAASDNNIEFDFEQLEENNQIADIKIVGDANSKLYVDDVTDDLNITSGSASFDEITLQGSSPGDFTLQMGTIGTMIGEIDIDGSFGEVLIKSAATEGATIKDFGTSQHAFDGEIKIESTGGGLTIETIAEKTKTIDTTENKAKGAVTIGTPTDFVKLVHNDFEYKGGLGVDTIYAEYHGTVGATTNTFTFSGDEGNDFVHVDHKAPGLAVYKIDLDEGDETLHAIEYGQVMTGGVISGTGATASSEFDGGEGSDTLIVDVMRLGAVDANANLELSEVTLGTYATSMTTTENDQYTRFENILFDYRENNVTAFLSAIDGDDKQLQAIGGTGNQLRIYEAQDEGRLRFDNAISQGDDVYVNTIPAVTTGGTATTTGTTFTIDFDDFGDFTTVGAGNSDEFGDITYGRNISTANLETRGEFGIQNISMTADSSTIFNELNIDHDAVTTNGDVLSIHGVITGEIDRIDASTSSGDIFTNLWLLSPNVTATAGFDVSRAEYDGSAGVDKITVFGWDAFSLGDSQSVHIQGNSGADNLVLTNSFDADVVAANGLSVTTTGIASLIEGGVGNDIITTQQVLAGKITIEGGEGADKIVLSNNTTFNADGSINLERAVETVVLDDTPFEVTVTGSELTVGLNQGFGNQHDTIEGFVANGGIAANDFKSDKINLGDIGTKVDHDSGNNGFSFSDVVSVSVGSSTTVNYELHEIVIMSGSVIADMQDLALAYNGSISAARPGSVTGFLDQTIIVADMDGSSGNTQGVFLWTDHSGDGFINNGDKVSLLAEVDTYAGSADIGADDFVF